MDVTIFDPFNRYLVRKTILKSNLTEFRSAFGHLFKKADLNSTNSSIGDHVTQNERVNIR